MKFFPDIHIHIHIHTHEASMGEIKQSLANFQSQISTQGLKIMATIEQIQAAQQQLIADTAAEKAEVTAKLVAVASALSTLEATVVSLQAQIAAGTGATPTQLDGVLAGIQAASMDVRNIFTPDAPSA